MKTFLWVLLFIVCGCTRIETNKDPVAPPAVVTDFEWTLMPKHASLEPRKMHTAIWTGKDWIIWGGILITDPEKNRALYGNGASYNPETSKWADLETQNAIEGRFGHTAVWTGTEMLIWGGARADTLNTGGRYNPTTKVWAPIKTPELTNRYFHRAVWTGDRMFSWGGLHLDQGGLASGGEYDPATDQWEILPTDNAPRGRHSHSLTLAGRKIYVWGGLANNEVGSALDSGAVFDLNKKEWIPMNSTGAPTARAHHTAVYGRKRLMIWGGVGKNENGTLTTLNSGAIYNTKTGTWSPISTSGAPRARHAHVAAWTGKKMLVWGGFQGSTVLSDGALYDPETDTWETLPQPPAAFSRRYFATCTWTGEALLVWGGSYATRGHSELGDGAILKFPTKELGD